ncbi:sensor histidine kinase KdpD [Thermoflexus sp.]|uniref:sensor histidine kinase KdpD n=1 Tax=Thermoflexus sp. TaxID=1969742 RepID=UPI0017C8F971|nr:sensor histidine kinase KdpD [Thermoflexus sp.]
MWEEVERPDPEAMLAQVKEEEPDRPRGRLKIFLGYAAGVGKTYAMLDAARQRRLEGVDVVVAYVETHGRPETEALLEGLEIIPRRRVEYRGIVLEEMDLDAVLARRPQLAVVDELAHTNAPGSRHAKRYQDVLEILHAGIDVYTTLNIQHVESLNDVIAQITGVRMKETVPDFILQEADEIELIDLDPDELLQRLREGKVYVPERAEWAIQHFFRKGNLIALRELAMRYVADRVDRQMRAYMRAHAIAGPWPAKERILVCVSPGTLSERLVRTGYRLAHHLNAEWFALYVETPGDASLSPAQRERLDHLLRLSEELGGHPIVLSGYDVVTAILDFARHHNVTKIVIGKPLRPRWYELIRGSVADRLIRKSGPIDVYVISSEAEAGASSPHAFPRWNPPPRAAWVSYLQSLFLVAVATGLGALLHSKLQEANLIMLYLTTVVVAGFYLGRGPAILASIAGTLAFDFFFVPPRLTFAVSDTQYLLTFLGLLAVGQIIGTLTANLRWQAEAAQQREAQTRNLYALSRALTRASNIEEIISALVRHVEEATGGEVWIFLPGADSKLELYARHPERPLSPEERGVAEWVYRNGRPAGRGTDTLASVEGSYFPMRTDHGTIGVLGIRWPSERGPLTSLERQRLEAFANLAALAFERAYLAEQAHQARLLEERDRLQSALLSSISHNLRTPLVTILGALTALQESDEGMAPETRRALLRTAREEAERMNRLVSNLLAVTRIEAGGLRVRKEPCEVQDLLNAALERLKSRLQDRPIDVRLPPDLPLIPMDLTLMEEALANILDNAVKYSPPGSPIEIEARLVGDRLEIDVADRGVGIPPHELERIFEKFYRIPRAGESGGLGLGLTIARSMVEAHGGTIRALNRPGGGTVFRISLPLDGDGRSGHGDEREEDSHR